MEEYKSSDVYFILLNPFYTELFKERLEYSLMHNFFLSGIIFVLYFIVRHCDVF